MLMYSEDNLIYYNNIRFKILLIDKPKPYLLSSYIVKIRKDTKDISINLEDILYRMINKEMTLLEKDVYYSRPKLQIVEINKGEVNFYIIGFEKILNRIRKIVMEYYNFNKDILNIYDYKYLKNELELYKRSFYTEKKACEMYYKYRLPWINSDKISFDSFIKEDRKELYESFLHGTKIRRGGKFDGCYYDDQDRLRPITTHVYYEIQYAIYDRFLITAILSIPSELKRHILMRHVTKNEVFECYNGKQTAIEFLEKSNMNFTKENEDLAIIFLKTAAMQPENNQFSWIKLNEFIFKGIGGTDQYLNVYNRIQSIISNNDEDMFKFIDENGYRDPKKWCSYIKVI